MDAIFKIVFPPFYLVLHLLQMCILFTSKLISMWWYITTCYLRWDVGSDVSVFPRRIFWDATTHGTVIESLCFNAGQLFSKCQHACQLFEMSCNFLAICWAPISSNCLLGRTKQCNLLQPSKLVNLQTFDQTKTRQFRKQPANLSPPSCDVNTLKILL